MKTIQDIDQQINALNEARVSLLAQEKAKLAAEKEAQERMKLAEEQEQKVLSLHAFCQDLYNDLLGKYSIEFRSVSTWGTSYIYIQDGVDSVTIEWEPMTEKRWETKPERVTVGRWSDWRRKYRRTKSGRFSDGLVSAIENEFSRARNEREDTAVRAKNQIIAEEFEAAVDSKFIKFSTTSYPDSVKLTLETTIILNKDADIATLKKINELIKQLKEKNND